MNRPTPAERRKWTPTETEAYRAGVREGMRLTRTVRERYTQGLTEGIERALAEEADHE